MGRAIGAAVVAYVVLVVVIFAAFAGAYAVLGPQGAFQPDTYDASLTWIVLSIAIGFVTAVLAGWLCITIARDPRGPKVLAVLVLIIGAWSAFAANKRQPPASRPEVVGLMDAVQNGKAPPWVNWLNPVIGVVGVMIGGRRRTPASA